MLLILVLSTKKTIEIVQNFQSLSHKSMSISKMEGYFKNPYFKRTYALYVGFKMKPLKCFPVLRHKPIFGVNLAEMLKEAIIHFFLIDELHFSNICTL